MSNHSIEFLEAFCTDYALESCNENACLEFDTCREDFSSVEIEGQCIEWIMSFLAKRGCGSCLAVNLTRLVVDRVVQKAREFSVETEQHDTAGPTRFSCEQLKQLASRQLVETCHSVDRATLTSFDSIVEPKMSVHSIKNTRRKMEDKHVLLPYFGNLFNNSNYMKQQNWYIVFSSWTSTSNVIRKKNCSSYFAVFDGHGGVEAAQYAATHLHCILSRHLNDSDHSITVDEALKKAFVDTDNMFIENARRWRWNSGSTAICALLQQDLLHIAWLGDSQALLVRDGQPVQLMIPHKPEREDERQRIEALGGCVLYIGAWRVNGSLSVSRAIGDAGFKPFVSGEPDVATFNYQRGDWLVLACDGLWDQVSYSDVASLLYSDDDKSTVARRLVQKAKDEGSCDNITVVVVCLDESVVSTANSSTLRTNSKRVNDEQDRGASQRNSASDVGSGAGAAADNMAVNQQQGENNNSSSSDRVNTDTEISRLATTVKRSARTCHLDDDSDDDVVVDIGETLSLHSASARSTESQAMLDSSQYNTLDMTKLMSLTDVMAVVTSSSVATRSEQSVTSSSWTTSEDISFNSRDPSSSGPETGNRLPGGEIGSDTAASGRRHVRRRTCPGGMSSLLKENRRPSDEHGVGKTPPCVHHVSPPPFDDTITQPSFDIKCGRSLSWVSSAAGSLLSQRAAAGGFSSGITVKSPVEFRSNRWPTSGNTVSGAASASSNRWTIAVEMEDPSADMFNTYDSVMNRSTHW